MAKKVRRPRKAGQPRSYAQTGRQAQPAPSQPAQTQAPAMPRPAGPAARTPAAVARTPGKAQAVDLATEYKYVVKDLRRMVVVAAAMLALLVVLNFIVQ